MKDKNRPLRRRIPARSLLSPSPSAGSITAAQHARVPVSLADVEKALEDKTKKLSVAADIAEEFESISDYCYDTKDLNQGTLILTATTDY